MVLAPYGSLDAFVEVRDRFLRFLLGRLMGRILGLLAAVKYCGQYWKKGRVRVGVHTGEGLLGRGGFGAALDASARFERERCWSSDDPASGGGDRGREYTAPLRASIVIETGRSGGICMLARGF